MRYVKIQKGTILNDTYEIIEEIGKGGAGVIYRAKHLRLKTDVVVKKLKDDVLGLVNARSEADILKKLKHPYLPRVYDFVEDEDEVYTVMDFIEGVDLKTAIEKHGPFLQKEILKWARQLGEALSYLHSQEPKIIHSDIKPSNIMITEEGNVCLIDFNVSLAMGENAESAVGISKGFSPPEQYRSVAMYKQLSSEHSNIVQENRSGTVLINEALNNEPKTIRTTPTTEYINIIGSGIDARSDIYSLGAVLLFMFTGVMPSPDFDFRITAENAGASISPGLAIVIDKMLQLNPDDRYQDGNDYLKAITNCYKLDKRYISISRKELLLQIIGILIFVAGIGCITFGIFLKNRQISNDYYLLIQQAEEAITGTNYDEAGQYIQDAYTISLTNSEAYREEIYLYYSEGNLKDCISRGEQYIAAPPFLTESEDNKSSYADIAWIVANAYIDSGDYSNAKTYIEFAIEQFPKNPLFYRDLAFIYIHDGKIADAQDCLSSAKEKGLSDDSIYMILGDIALSEGNIQEAIGNFDSAISATDDLKIKTRAKLLMANAYVSGAQTLGNEEEYYNKALSIYKDLYSSGYLLYQLRENMAIIYENMNDTENAESILLQLMADYPNKYEVYKRLAFLEADKQQSIDNSSRNYNMAREYYNKSLSLYNPEINDAEMGVLEKMFNELEAGGWFNE